MLFECLSRRQFLSISTYITNLGQNFWRHIKVCQQNKFSNTNKLTRIRGLCLFLCAAHDEFHPSLFLGGPVIANTHSFIHILQINSKSNQSNLIRRCTFVCFFFCFASLQTRIDSYRHWVRKIRVSLKKRGIGINANPIYFRHNFYVVCACGLVAIKCSSSKKRASISVEA